MAAYTQQLAQQALAIIAAAEADGVTVDDGNVVDLLADNLAAPLADLRSALVTAGLASRFPQAATDGGAGVEYGTCGRDGCSGQLVLLAGYPETADCPAEPPAWECRTCGRIRDIDPLGEIDYSN